MTYKCIICEREISNEDIFMRIELEMTSLIYSDTRNEKDFLVPNGPIRLREKIYLCNVCSHGLMRSIPKDIAVAIVENKFIASEKERVNYPAQ